MTPRFGAFVFASLFAGLDEATVLGSAVRYAVAAEQAGFEDLWISEHHAISYGVNPSALTMAGYLLGRTTRARVGTAVTLLPHHPPVFVAEQAALLAHISGGRFDLGLGRGGPNADILVAGREFAHWSQGYWEAVDLVRAAWTGRAGADSALYRFPEVVVRPTPPAPVPIFTASTSTTSIDEAARRGIPLLLFLHETDESRRAAVERWAGVAAEHGHPTDHPGHAFALVGQVTDGSTAQYEAIRQRLLSFFVRSSAEYVLLPEAAEHGKLVRTPEQLEDYTRDIAATHPIGTADHCAARLAETIRASGVDRVLLMLESAADPDAVLRNVRTFGESVLPAVRHALHTAPAHG